MGSLAKHWLDEGIEKGIEKGIGKGKEEKAIEVAKKMLGKGTPISEVSELTNLSVAELEKLSAELSKRR